MFTALAVGGPSAASALSTAVATTINEGAEDAKLSSWTGLAHDARCESQIQVSPGFAIRSLKQTKTNLNKAALRESALVQAIFSLQKRTFQRVRTEPAISLVFAWYHHFP